MELLENIKKTLRNGEYALRPHAITHILAEGFTESDISEAAENGKILESYENENRCLIVGTFRISERTAEHLHIVIDYWFGTDMTGWIDIVTAYIPRRPFWETPYQRGRRKK